MHETSTSMGERLCRAWRLPALTILAVITLGVGSGSADAAPITTTITVTSSANPAAVGQQVTYTATVSPTPPGGSVSFSGISGGISGCASIPLSGGTASCSTTYSRYTDDLVSAGYSGVVTSTATYYPADTATNLYEHILVATATTIGAFLTGNSVPLGMGVHFEATVVTVPALGPSNGTVTFEDGGTPISGCTALAMSVPGGPSPSSALCGTIFTTTGTHSISVVYSGDNFTLPSTSNAFAVTVDATSGTSTGGGSGTTTSSAGTPAVPSAPTSNATPTVGQATPIATTTAARSSAAAVIVSAHARLTGTLPALRLTVQSSKQIRVVFSLRGPKGKTLARWNLRVQSGRHDVVLSLPLAARRAGTDRLQVLEPDGRTTSLRVVLGKR